MLQRFPDGFLRWISSLDNAHTVSIWLEGCVCYIFFGTYTPASFWGGCFALFAFRGVVCNSFRVQQIFNLASQHLCYPPELVNVRAFPMPCTPALYRAIAQTSPAAKLPAADPGGLAALVDGISCMCLSHGVDLLFIQYTADAVKMEEQSLPYKRGNVWTFF